MFVDTTKDIQDSIRDIHGALDKRLFGIAEQPQSADIVLTVLARGISSECVATITRINQVYSGNGGATVFGNSVVWPTSPTAPEWISRMCRCARSNHTITQIWKV
jgi:hypothetical protein